MSRCPICGAPCDPRLLAQSADLLPSLARRITAAHPTWQGRHGLCPTCAHRYATALAAELQPVSLHTHTSPHTTFPYYHADEEFVLSQPERLPDYGHFRGRDVTIAFLDSGYYPHPDLTAAPTWPTAMPDWSHLSGPELQTILAEQPLRIVQYVDLTNDGERVGLDQPSLWDGAGDSWHGQMTTTIVAGNGLLSGGRYRGYASEATLLPIKIGRGGGRIPEADILRGLEWLLTDDNWARYNVRVLNISVGGDFVQPWRENPVCRAAETLAARGVVIAAAVGNSGKPELRAPASAPSVISVGGVDDGNRRWSTSSMTGVADYMLYPHTYGTVRPKDPPPTQVRPQRRPGPLHKPELLALARWLPAPILPVSPIAREVAMIGELRRLLLGYDPWRNDAPALPSLVGSPEEVTRYRPPQWMPEVWHGVRQRMNAHKWIHSYYQHVDGTSVSVAQVSAVAAQMIEANVQLTGEEIRTILLETALPLPTHPPHVTGAGLLQPRAAVAKALRTAGGPLTPYPQSGTRVSVQQVQELAIQLAELPNWAEASRVKIEVAGTQAASASEAIIYLGIFAPHASAVSLIGTFNEWQPGCHHLVQTTAGWWHCTVTLASGLHLYRFWVESPADPAGTWVPDAENSLVTESGYVAGHSVIQI